MYGADQVVADIIFVKVNGLLKYRIACGRAGNDRASSRRIERAIDRKHDGKDCSDLPLKTATKGPVKRYIMPSAKKTFARGFPHQRSSEANSRDSAARCAPGNTSLLILPLDKPAHIRSMPALFRAYQDHRKGMP